MSTPSIGRLQNCVEDYEKLLSGCRPDIFKVSLVVVPTHGNHFWGKAWFGHTRRGFPIELT